MALTRKPRRKPCPYCRSRDTSRILYGLYAPNPARPLPDDAILGGCCVGPDSPRLRCNICGRGSEFMDFGDGENT